MKKSIIPVVWAVLTVTNMYSQDTRLDTVYYDSRWKSVQTPAMATY